ncbi:MAG: hypothetical protein SGPRY_012249 [Prymnesium sp.]
MSDLLSRINSQNAEIDQARGHLDSHSSVILTQQALASQTPAKLEELQPPQPPQPPQPAARGEITEESLRAQERELERQLQLERELQLERARAGPPRREAKAPPSQNKENQARGSIPLMPGSRRGSQSEAQSVTPTERRRRPVHFSHLMVKESSTSQMEDFLNPVTSIRDQMRRAGVEPKNHQREQRERISGLTAERRQATEMAAMREAEKKKKEQAFREKSVLKHQTAKAIGPSAYPEPTSGVATAGRRASKQIGEVPSRHHTPGAVPEYLRRRKEQWAAEAEAEAARAAAEADCPPGLRLVGAEEKERILQTLADEKGKSMLELQSLPFVIKTKAAQQRKDQLEERLEQIDQATTEYLKEKVYVPAN